MKIRTEDLTGGNRYDNALKFRDTKVNPNPLTKEEMDYIIKKYGRGCSSWNENIDQRWVTIYKKKNRYLCCPNTTVDFSRVSCVNGIYSGMICINKTNEQCNNSETTYFQII